MLLSGFGRTLAVVVLAWIMVFILDSLIDITRTTDRRWLVMLSGAYVKVFRNIPLLVQFFIWFYVVPGVIPVGKRLVISLSPSTQRR